MTPVIVCRIKACVHVIYVLMDLSIEKIKVRVVVKDRETKGTFFGGKMMLKYLRFTFINVNPAIFKVYHLSHHTC